jgi:uncharacterized cupredoxin-like copper-binding protein
MFLAMTACSRADHVQEEAASSAQPEPAPAVAASAAETAEHGEHEHEEGGDAGDGHAAGGDGDADHEHGDHGYSFGQPGDATAVARTVTVTGGDDFKFHPAHLTVKTGETIHFNVKNTGKHPHEFTLGDEASQKKHAEMMKQMPGMVHADPNMLTLQPGEDKSLIWQFTRAGKVEFACHVPGHYEAGMRGVVDVAD